MASESFDVVVIGAGPGGYVAAIRAAQNGLKACVVEREHLGGICLNWGCIPTKAMLRSSEVFHLMHRAKEFGLKVSGVDYDLDAVVKRSRDVAKQLSGGVGHLLKKNKVAVVMGAATVTAPGKVQVKTGTGVQELTAQTSSWPPARGRVNCRGLKPMVIWSGLTNMRCCHRGCPSGSWSLAQGPLESNLPASTTLWAVTRRWSK